MIIDNISPGSGYIRPPGWLTPHSGLHCEKRKEESRGMAGLQLNAILIEEREEERERETDTAAREMRIISAEITDWHQSGLLLVCGDTSVLGRW